MMYLYHGKLLGSHIWMITFNSVLYAGDLDGELIVDPLGLSGSDFNVTVQRDRAVWDGCHTIT